MCYKVKILFYIEELTKKAHIPRDFVHDAGKTWVCNLFCSLPPIECLLLGYFPDVFWVTTKFSLLTDGWVTLFLYGWHLVHWLWLVYLIHHQKWEHSWGYYYYCRVVKCLYFVLKHRTDWGLSIKVLNIINCQYHKLISALWWLEERLWKCESSIFKIELDFVNPVTLKCFLCLCISWWM